MRALLAGSLLFLAVQAQAAESAASMGKRYLKLKDNGDLYVGEGVAAGKDFGGDGLKALAAAKERARASLAAAVRVRIVSETREESKSGPQGSTETVESRSASLADVVLEDVRYEDFIGFPEEGQVSSLAYVSKADYRRQLAGKGPRVYRPEWGLRLAFVATSNFSIAKLVNDEDLKRRNNPAIFNINTNSGGSNGGSADGHQGVGLEFRFRDWTLLLEQGLTGDVKLSPYDPKTATYKNEIGPTDLVAGGIGYDLTPWAWRLQPYLPLGIKAVHAGIAGSYEAWTAAGTAGLGLRWWPNDSLAFDASGRWIQGLGGTAFKKSDGTPFYTGPGKEAEFSANGAQWQISILWSGF